MPKVIPLTSELKVEYQQEKLTDDCELLMKKKKVTKKQVAELLGCTPQNVSYQFRCSNITLPVLIAIATLTDADEKWIGERLKVK